MMNSLSLNISHKKDLNGREIKRDAQCCFVVLNVTQQQLILFYGDIVVQAP